MKIKLSIILFTALLVFQGCDDELEILPTDSISSATLYNTEAGALAGLTGIYSRLIFLYKDGNFAAYPSVNTDEGVSTRWVTQASAYLRNDFTTNENGILQAWTRLYEGINASNAFINNLANSALEESVKLAFTAEARFLRGLYYLELQKAFGGSEGIPMPLEETNNQPLPRTPGIDVYKQIITDLEFAEQHLPLDADTTPGRAGKGAAQGLLARAYLYMAGEPINAPGAYEKAREWSKKIMDDGFHELNPSYSDIFTQLAQEKYDKKEMLFQIAFYNNDTNRYMASFASNMGFLTNDVECGRSYPLVHVPINMTLKYREDPTDERGLWNASPYSIPNKKNCEFKTTPNQYNYVASKYRGYLMNSFVNIWGVHHWPYLRFSDVVLMYAEAENHLNPGSSEALAAVNSVRNRAKATPLTEINLELIQEERKLELCYEGLRRYDLVRWGILTQKVEQTKTIIQQYALSSFPNEDWTIYGEPNLGPDGIPLSGDEPDDPKIRKNSLGGSLVERMYYGYNNYNETQHKILPIPEVEVGANPHLDQTQGW